MCNVSDKQPVYEMLQTYYKGERITESFFTGFCRLWYEKYEVNTSKTTHKKAV